MDDLFVLKDIEQVRAVADPLRQRILEMLIEASLTTKQVAQQLKEQPTRLYHHVDILEAAGLIKLVETKPKRGTVEKYYRSVARSFTVDRDLFAARPQSDENVRAWLDVFSGMFETTLTELRESVAAKLIQRDDPKHEARLSRNTFRASPAQIARLNEKIQQLIDECEEIDSEDGEVAYGLTIAFYPIVSPKSRKGKQE